MTLGHDVKLYWLSRTSTSFDDARSTSGYLLNKYNKRIISEIHEVFFKGFVESSVTLIGYEEP